MNNKDKINKQKKEQGYHLTQSAKKRLRSEVAKLKAQIKDHESKPTLEELQVVFAPITASATPQNPLVAAALRLRSILKKRASNNGT